MAERLIFLTGHLARARLERLLAGSRRDRVRLGDRRYRRQGRGADDRGHHCAPAEAAGRRRPHHPARPLPRRSRRLSASISACRSCAARTRSPTCRPFSAAPASRPICPGTTCASSPRSSMRRCCRSTRWSQRADTCRCRRRRHRPRLPAGNAVSACLARRCGQLKGAGAFPSASIPPISMSSRSARGRRGLSAQPRRAHAAAGLRIMASTPVLIPSNPGDLDSLGRAIASGASGRHRLHRRSGARPDPFRLCRVARPLPRGAPPLAGDRTADGHRQSHRTDRRRQFRRHGGAGRALLRARRSATCLSCMSARTRCARSRSTTSRAASCLPPRSDGACRAAIDPGLLQVHDRKPYPATRRGHRRARRRRARRQFPHHDRRGRHPIFNGKGHQDRAGRFRTFRRARR